ncbi:hypothetical protein [Gilvibacter sp.]|uniref:hypothetical protein n=1 Tax=Gilvibacter sp. TaxID=2729997 RepID=UPI0025B920E3|nr:hypothetical protein [Gilvibacter sp.]NQX77530.1 hypothetical protein [Gilvibacter sp.]
MKPSISKLEKLMRTKSKAYSDQTKQLFSLTDKLDRQLYTFVKDNILPTFVYSSDSRIKSTGVNLDASRNIKQLKDYISGTLNKDLQKFYARSAKRNADVTNRYFNLFNPSKAISSSVARKGTKSLEVLVASIFTKSNVQSEVESALSNAVLSNSTTSEATQALSDIIRGKDGGLGVNQRYHYQQGQDAIRAHGSLLDNSFSQALNLNYAVYTGSEKTTTRSFCKSRIGNVYSRDEILSWQDLEWSGKKKGHNIILDRGGWNCGHQYAWVSYELAKELRKDVPKSSFDKR